MSGARIAFWDPGRQFGLLEEEIVPEMLTTLGAGDLVMRQQMEAFERDFAAFIGRDDCVSVSNCTDGLRLTLEALGVGEGDEVITVSHTFIATIAAIHHVGASPILVDVGSDHLMDPNAFEAAITDRTRAVIPVHLNGRTCDMVQIMRIADDHALLVVEDAAQAVGALLDGKVAGTFGAAATYSFYPAKLLGAYGDAGAVVTDDRDLAHRLRLLRDHGRLTKSDLDGWGWNCRLDNLQAVVLNVKLRHVTEWIERRREIEERYEAALTGVDGIVLPPGPDENGRWYDVFQNYVIESDRRDELQRHLRDEGIETLISWPKPNHRQRGLGLDHFNLPVTEKLCERVLSLPMFPELSDEEVERVVSAVKAFR